ncbi:MAG: PLP-dependent aminotransferase family protein [Spirochaetales bacterium]|nr:PLP-dependent aminotransferase family protein [Spirochaetales bacterium]
MERIAHYDKKKETLYGEVAAKLELQILSGVYKVGEKLPSLRELSRRLGVSLNTVREAYGNLETRRIIEGVPQSGYYVQERADENRTTLETPLDLGDNSLVQFNAMMSDFFSPALSPLCCATFDLASLPYSRELELSRDDQRSMDLFSYPKPEGLYDLRLEIAKRSIDSGYSVQPEDILITAGGMAGISLAIHALTKPGDTIAIESPIYFVFMYLIREYGLKVIEIPSDPETGMSLDILQYVTEQHPVKIIISMPNFQNPTGSVMPVDNKKRLMKLISEKDIILLEDDIYGDINFTDKRPPALKAFDPEGRVILCSSFSKSLAPGLRLGWMIPGRYREEILAVKTMIDIAVSIPSQMMALRFIQSGHYDRHIRLLRKRAGEKMSALMEDTQRYFPPQVHSTKPDGGFLLWFTLPGEGDLDFIHEEAKKQGVSFAAGKLFSLEDRWRNCFRLNAGRYGVELKPGIKILGELLFKYWKFPG